MQVDVAVECARLQHRLSMPPLEVEDFPQVGLTNYKAMPTTSMRDQTQHETDILQEILSVAHASQQLINPSNNDQHANWGGSCSNYADDDFTFMTTKGMYQNQANEMMSCPQQYMNKSLEEYYSTTRSIDTSDQEDLKMDRSMVENLRWVGMSSKDLEQVTLLQINHLIYH